jgi:small-conductance mechanosensitive channel
MKKLSFFAPLLVLGACSPAVDGNLEDASLSASLVEEARHLQAVLDVSTIVTLVAMVTMLFIGGRLLDQLALSLARKDSPFAKLVDEGRPLLKAIVVAAFVIMLLRAFIQETPMVGAISIALLVAGIFFRVGGGVLPWAAGFMLVARGEIHERDRILLDGREGVVRRIGWIHVRVRFDDGTEAVVPLSHIGGGGASIASPRSSVALEVHKRVARPLTADDIETLEGIMRLSPYRDASHPLRVRVDGDDETKLIVAMHVWSDAAVPLARTFIARAVSGEDERNRGA